MAHKGGIALSQKLSELGCPLEARTDALESLYGNPSMRLQAFLDWFVNGLDAKACGLPANFTADELVLLNSSQILDGDSLKAKEIEVFTDENDFAEEDDDEDALQEEIDHLEKLIAVEMKKQSVLQYAVEDKRTECAAVMEENILPDESMEERSLGDAVDDFLSKLDQEKNEFQLAFLAPKTCALLAVQEDKLLDDIQSVLTNGPRKRSSSIALETIPESPSHSNQVRWLHESLFKEMPMVSASKEQEYILSSAEFNRLVKAFPKGELYALNSSLELAKRKAMHVYRHEQSQHVLDRCRLMPTNVLTKNYQELTQHTAELQQQTQHILTQILPKRLEELGRLQMTSVVLGDYMGKVTRQSKYLDQQDEVLRVLECQSARLLLLSQLLTFEKSQMASIQADLQGIKANIDNHSIALARRMQSRPFAPMDINSESKILIDFIQSVLGPTAGSLDEQCRSHASQMEQLESIRSNIRDEYHLALQKQLNAITELKEALSAMELDTYQAVEALEMKKNDIAQGISDATKVFQDISQMLSWWAWVLIALAIVLFIVLLYMSWPYFVRRCCASVDARDKDMDFTEMGDSSTKLHGSKIPSIASKDLEILGMRGGGIYTQVMKAKYNEVFVAVKKFHYISNFKTFKKQAMFIYKLPSDNIVQLLGMIVENKKSPELVFEFMDGGSLDTFIINQRRRKTPFSKQELALAIAKGLQRLHEHNVVHRDLRSRNILLSTDGRVKLADFGFARDNAPMRENTYVQMSFVGSAPPSAPCFGQSYYNPVAAAFWVAPEVLVDHENQLIESDIYSFGVILTELDTLGAPFSSIEGPILQTLTQVQERSLIPQLSSSCEPWYREITERCMNADPKQRPKCSEIIQILEQHVSD